MRCSPTASKPTSCQLSSQRWTRPARRFGLDEHGGERSRRRVEGLTAGIEPAVQELWFGLMGRKLEEAERGAERGDARGRHPIPSAPWLLGSTLFLPPGAGVLKQF